MNHQRYAIKTFQESTSSLFFICCILLSSLIVSEIRKTKCKHFCETPCQMYQYYIHNNLNICNGLFHKVIHKSIRSGSKVVILGGSFDKVIHKSIWPRSKVVIFRVSFTKVIFIFWVGIFSKTINSRSLGFRRISIKTKAFAPLADFWK